MNIEKNTHGAVTVLKPVGAVAQADAEELYVQLQDVGRQSLWRLVLDVSGVPFMDSRGLEVLLDVSETMATSGQALKLCGLSDLLREVLELTDVLSSCECFEDVNSAVRSFL